MGQHLWVHHDAALIMVITFTGSSRAEYAHVAVPGTSVTRSCATCASITDLLSGTESIINPLTTKLIFSS